MSLGRSQKQDACWKKRDLDEWSLKAAGAKFRSSIRQKFSRKNVKKDEAKSKASYGDVVAVVEELQPPLLSNGQMQDWA